MPTGVVPVPTHWMTGAQFRLFQERCPDHERWELVKGTPMMVPPTIAHRHIAGNPTRILNDALAKHDQAQIAVSASGVDLGDAALGLDRPGLPSRA